jgi:RHS repeat-associated protein
VNTYSWNAEQHLNSAANVTYTYDGDLRRVKKSSGTLYWYCAVCGNVLAESDLSGNITSEYIYFAGRKIARRDGSGNVYYMFADHLGSTHTVTNSTGTPCGVYPERMRRNASFMPYGTEVLNPNVSQTCAPNYKFTGYEYDPETGNYYAFARFYSPRLGRFLSPDPLAGATSSPQSLNRYAYVANNPLNAADPTGMVTGLCMSAGRRRPGHAAASAPDGGCAGEGGVWGGSGGGEADCSIDLDPAPCAFADMFAAADLAEVCPGDVCAGVGPHGFVWFVAGAGGASGRAPAPARDCAGAA